MKLITVFPDVVKLKKRFNRCYEVNGNAKNFFYDLCDNNFIYECSPYFAISWISYW